MVKNIFFLFLGLAFFISCNQEDKVEEEISKIPVDIKIERFDKVFAEASPSDIPQLKKRYPLLFPEQYADSVWVKMLQDTIQQELNREVVKAFPEVEQTEEIESLFQHVQYYFPQVSVPRVITITS